MLKSIFPLFVFLFFKGTAAWAVGLVELSPNLGFYEQGNRSVPASVEDASLSIFRIELDNWQQVPAGSYDFFLQHPNSSPSLKQHLSDCKTRNKPMCLAPFGQIRGTAFLDEDPSYIWTNCHLVQSWMQSAARNHRWQKRSDISNYFSNTPLPFRLTSANGKTVFKKDNDQAFLVAFSPLRDQNGYYVGCNPVDDMVKIKIKKPFATKGIKRSRLQDDETLFIGGFPKPTGNRHLLGAHDSDGENFYWTQGPFLDKTSPSGLNYLVQKENIEFAISGPYLSVLLSDGVEGMSGGPVLNRFGEVVGIYRGYLAEESEIGSDIPFVSLFFNTNGMRFLEILSAH